MNEIKCPHCGEEIDLFGKGGGEKMAKEMEVPFLGFVPIEPALRQEEDAGDNVIASHPESASAKAFAAIARQMEAQLK